MEWLDVCRLGQTTCPVHTLNIFFNALSTFPIFLAAIFVTSPSIVIAGLANSILRWVNSQKCLMKIQYREFKGSAMIAIGEGVKIAAEKIKPTFSNFFGAIFVTYRGFCDDCDGVEGGVVGWRKSRPEKSNRFRFFRMWFSSPNFPHQRFWEFKILKNVGRRHNIANSRVLRLWFGGWG